jgi:hypothetical protein
MTCKESAEVEQRYYALDEGHNESGLTHKSSYPVTGPIAKHWLSVFAAGDEQI